jgi:hypothetical protein
MRIFIQRRFHVNLLCALLLLFMQKTNAQTIETVGVPFTGSKGITISAADIEARSRIEDAKPKSAKIMRDLQIERSTNISEDVNSPALPSISNLNTNNVQRSTSAAQTIHSNFSGINFNEVNAWPSNGTGDVGTTQICMLSYGRLKFFGRNTVCQPARTTPQTNSDSVLPAPAFNVDLNVFFSAIADTNNVSVQSPRVRFDRLTRRWFIIGHIYKYQSNRIVIAVSNGTTVTSAANFTFFYFVSTQLPPVPTNYVNGYFESTSLGIDKNALYIGGRVFNNGNNYINQGNSLIVIRKSSILGIGTIVVTGFHVPNSDMVFPQAVHNTDPNATVGFFIATTVSTADQRFYYYKVNNPSLTPFLSASLRIITPTYKDARNQRGPLEFCNIFPFEPKYLYGNYDLIFGATLIKNKITGLHTIWTAHAISVDSAGGPGGLSSGIERNGSRYYEFTNIYDTPTIYQHGTLFDTAIVNPRGFWIPTITGTGQGHAVMGCSTSGFANFVDVAVTGRYNTDPLGTLQPFQLATASNSFYNPFFDCRLIPWGFYSQTVLDPLDDMTVWTFQTYVASTNKFAVRAVQLKAPPPATPNPIGTVGCGFFVNGTSRYVQVTINGSSINNAGFFDPGSDIGGPGYNRLTVTSTGSGLIVGDINFVSPTKILLEMIFPPSLAGSTQTLTITNPDCQSVTTTYTLPTACNGNVYTFNGSGNWNDANNWMFGNIPPTTLTSPDEIVIDPVAGGECLMNIPSQTIASGAKLTLKGTKKFRIVGNLINQ